MEGKGIFSTLRAIPLKAYVATALFAGVLVAAGMYGGSTLFPRKETISVETIRYITNFEHKMSTDYAPANGDSGRYTNLYNDCSGLLARTIELTNTIANLQRPDMSIHYVLLGGYVNREIPVMVGAGVEWMSIGVVAAAGWNTVAIFAYKRF